MNINQLWSGNDYAYYEFKGRNEPFRMNAQRVRIIRVFKRREIGNTRESGYADVLLIDEEGNPVTNSDGTHKTREVRARDIAMRWREYEEERDYRITERDRLSKENDEAELRETELRSRIGSAIEEQFGIPSTAIYMNSSHVFINRVVLEEKLGLR